MARKTTRRRKKRAAGTVTQRPWQRIKNPYKPIEVLSADQIEHIHRASLDVIETLGVDMWSDEGLDIFDAAGAEVDRANRHVRIDRHLIEEAVAKAPAEFTLTPRNPARAVVLGGNNINFAPVGGPGFSTDIDRGRRSGSFADACDLIRLSQCLEVIHLTGPGRSVSTRGRSRRSCRFPEAAFQLPDSIRRAMRAACSSPVPKVDSSTQVRLRK